MPEKSVYTIELCPVEKLKCITCSLQSDGMLGDIKDSWFHERILKCRLLIFYNRQIFAAPTPKSSFDILIVFLGNEENESKITQMLINLKLAITRNVEVTMDILETVLKYTMEARLAPLWNVVNDVFVYGRNFLQEKSFIKAVKVKLTLSDNILQMELECSKMILRAFDFQDLSIWNDFSVEYFNNYSDSRLTENSFAPQSVSVLPRMTKAWIVSVNKKMPTTHFANYNELRRHWKNIYGYRLPNSEEGLLFYEVGFMIPNSKILTYPSLCLRSNQTLIDARPSEAIDTANEFMKDFSNHFLTIFDHPIMIQPVFPLTTILSSTPDSDLYDSQLASLPLVENVKNSENKIFDYFSQSKNKSAALKPLSQPKKPRTTRKKQTNGFSGKQSTLDRFIKSPVVKRL